MQIFTCQACGQTVFFENSRCMGCGQELGYLPDLGVMSPVQPDGPVWIAAAAPDRRYRFCENWERSACNWMLPAEEGEGFCRACRHNRTVPDLSDPANHARWQKIEVAKRRLIYSLLKLGLPLPLPGEGHPEPLVFDFLADRPGDGVRVMTGHDNGLITISLDEADDAAREKMRTDLGEAYRTLLGHFRHEVGHYYWDLLVRDGGALEAFRATFGDDRADYGAALQRHYQQGAPAGWQNDYVSAYATMHPWEDWAETWAHYLHMVDTLEMADAFGIRIDPEADRDSELSADLSLNPHEAPRIGVLVRAWMPLTMAVNSLNRAMGQPDIYPFTLPPRAVEKLGFVHDLVHGRLAAG